MTRKALIYLAPVFLTLLTLQFVYAQNQSELSLEKIMQGDKWIGNQPDAQWWSHNSREIYFRWNPENNPSDSLYRYNIRNSQASKVSPPERNEILPSRLIYNNKRNAVVFIRNGDLFFRDLKHSETIQLTSTLKSVSSPAFTADDKGISFITDNNLFILYRETGKTRQITDFRSGNEPSESSPGEQSAWLEDQQISLFDVLKERNELEQLRREQSEKQQPERPLTIYTGNSRTNNIQVSPGGRFVT